MNNSQQNTSTSNNNTRKRNGNKNNSISNDVRTSLVRLVNDQGHSIKEASELLQINYGSAKTIVKNYKTTGKHLRNVKGGSKKSVITNDIISCIENLVTYNPQYTLKEIRENLILNGQNMHDISISSINRCLQGLQITMKLTHRELDRVNMPDKIELRRNFSLWFNNYFENNFSYAVFIDESGFNLHLKRSYGRSRQGSRAISRIPVVRGRSISLLASLTIEGMGFCKTICNSTVNGEIFSEYLEELCVYLRDIKKFQKACLILDNARIHKRNDIERITARYGFDFKFLSPYSYMLNPCENAFSKIKNGVRSKLRQGATGSLSELIMGEIPGITSIDCSGYFRYILRNIINCAAGLAYIHQ
jgi:transposase